MDDTDDPTEPVTLAESLVALQAQRAAGTVVVSLNDHATRIFVRDGAPVAVQAMEAPEPTGDADTIWETLVSCLQWVEPTIVFEPNETLPEELTGDPCQVEPLILEAVRRQFDLQELDAAIGPFMAHRPRVLGDVAAIAERCGLYGADEQDYVALASRAETVEDLLVEGPVDLLEGYQLLYGLVLLGAVSLHDPSEPWEGPEPATLNDLNEEPIDDFDDEPIDPDGETATPEPPSSGRLSQDVADAFDPSLAEFLLDVVQESEPAPASDPAPAREPPAEDDDLSPLDPNDSLPPPPPPRPRMDTAPSASERRPDVEDAPRLDQDDPLPPPPPTPTPARVPGPPPAARTPSREALLRQADEDARRILAEARAAQEAEHRRQLNARKPRRDPEPAPRDRARPSREPRAAEASAPDPRPSRPRASSPAPRTDPRAPDRRSAGGRVIIEERVNTGARDSRVAVRQSRRPAATSVRPRPVVTRRKRAVPSSPGHPATPPARDSSPSRPSRSPTSPSPQTSPPTSPSPRTTPPAGRSLTPPAGRSTPPRGQSTPPRGPRTMPSRRSSTPRGSNPALPSDPGPVSHRGRSFTPPPHSSPRHSGPPHSGPPHSGPPHSGAGPSGTAPAADAAVTERQKQLARLHLKKGKRFLYRNNATRALPELEKAAELDPSSVELQLFALWARFTVAPGNADAAKATERQLRELAGKAMSDDRKFGFAHFVMGQLALREGRNGDAVRSLGAAVKLDPDNQDAKRGHQIAKRRATK